MGKRKLTVEKLAEVEVEPYPAEAVASMNERMAPAKWEEQRRRLRFELLFAHKVLGKTKEELAATAAQDGVAEALMGFVEDAESSAEWLRSAASLLESAATRVMIGMAASDLKAKKAKKAA